MRIKKQKILAEKIINENILEIQPFGKDFIQSASLLDLLKWVVHCVVRDIPEGLSEDEVEERIRKFLPELQTIIMLFVQGLNMSIEELWSDGEKE